MACRTTWIAIGVASAFASASAAEARRPVRHPHPLTVGRGADPARPAAASIDVAIGATGVLFRTPFQIVTAGERSAVVRVPAYRGPDGSYDTLTDEIQAVNGTPCGEECTRRSLARWGYAPAD